MSEHTTFTFSASAALSGAVEAVSRSLPEFTYACRNHSSVNNVYPACENDQWACGFWPGQIWLAYEHTGDPVFRHAALIQAESFLDRAERGIAVDHHDMGFLYTPSCVAAYRLTGSARARRAALLAADWLLARWQPKGRFFQAWGAMDEPGNYRFIIDCLLNLPLLFWASETTGNPEYRRKAELHLDTCLRHSFREDGSTFHTFYMNPQTGAPVRGVTCQGYRDDSAWARGQAWAIYGTALAYRYTRDARCVGLFRKAARFFAGRLPEDLVPYWELVFGDGSGEPRDSSSAAIAACGLLEMAPFLPEDEAAQCRDFASRMVCGLAGHYAVRPEDHSNGLLLHGTYSKKSPYNTCTPEGVDECVVWGDYFYMEALTRLSREWTPYW